MKILILTNFDVGLYQFRRELIAELLRENEVYISLPYGDLVEPLKEMGCRFLDTPMERRGMNPFRDAKLFFSYCAILRQVKPDLVITYTTKPNVYGGLAARLAHIPYAANITGLGTAFQKKGLLKTFVTVLYKLGCRKAKTVYFENSENRDIFLQAGIITEKQVCLLNGAGVNLDRYSLLDYPEGEETRFLYIGRVMQEKGIDELFCAMERLVAEGVNCTLDVVGRYEEDYKTRVEQCEAAGWLRYHGYQKDVRPYIASSHCFVLPSWHEGMANSNLECAASGRPIITSKIHGCLEAVEDGVSGYLVEKKNVNSLLYSMKRFSELPYEKRCEMGYAGRMLMEERFDKRKVVLRTVENLF